MNSKEFGKIKQKKVHIIGIGGVSTSGLAKYFKSKGYTVTGSDKHYSATVRELRRLGIDVKIGHSEKNIENPSAVIYTSAIADDNPELVYAKSNCNVFKRSVVLGNIIKEYKTSVCVSGSHGKTTATAMIAHILIKAKKDPTVFLGGESIDYGNFRKGKNDFAVIEACEYKKNFLDLSPNISVVLNIDNDHQDSFCGIQDEIDAFNKFIGKSVAIINADDKNAVSASNRSTVTFGIENDAVYTAKCLKKEEHGYSFTAYKYGKKMGKITLSVLGKHNVYNALSSFALADIIGVPFACIKDALFSFTGVSRRAENIGTVCNISATADYAHHPSEIIATLSALDGYSKNTLIVFQPHTYSRTKCLFKEFITALYRVNNLIIYKTYPAREKYDKNGSAQTLFNALKEKGVNCQFIGNKKTLYSAIKSYQGKINSVIFVGAGDIYEIAKKICDKLK